MPLRGLSRRVAYSDVMMPIGPKLLLVVEVSVRANSGLLAALVTAGSRIRSSGAILMRQSLRATRGMSAEVHADAADSAD